MPTQFKEGNKKKQTKYLYKIKYLENFMKGI